MLDKTLPLDGYLTMDRIFNLLLISSSQKTIIKPTVQAMLFIKPIVRRENTSLCESQQSQKGEDWRRVQAESQKAGNCLGSGRVNDMVPLHWC